MTFVLADTAATYSFKRPESFLGYVVVFLVLCSVPILIDLFFGVLVLMRDVRGRGPSSVPLLTLFLYGGLIFWPSQHVAPLSLGARFLMFGAAIVVHFLLQFGIPAVIYLLLARLSIIHPAGDSRTPTDGEYEEIPSKKPSPPKEE